MAESKDKKLTTIYGKNGSKLEVNNHVINCLKSGDKTLKNYSLKKPK